MSRELINLVKRQREGGRCWIKTNVSVNVPHARTFWFSYPESLLFLWDVLVRVFSQIQQTLWTAHICCKLLVLTWWTCWCDQDLVTPAFIMARFSCKISSFWLIHFTGVYSKSVQMFCVEFDFRKLWPFYWTLLCRSINFSTNEKWFPDGYEAGWLLRLAFSQLASVLDISSPATIVH